MITPKPDLSAQQSGQPAEAGATAKPSPTEGAQESKASGGLSADDIRQIVKETMSETLTSFRREEQSARDKLENRIKNEVQKTLNRMQKAGQEITDAVRQTVEQDVRSELDQVHVSEATPAQGQAQEPTSKPAPIDSVIAFVNAEVVEMEKEFGLELKEDDPEAEMVNVSDPPRKFLSAYEKALQAKKARIDASETGTPGAALPLMGGGSTPGNPIAEINDANVLLAQGLKKLGKRK